MDRTAVAARIRSARHAADISQQEAANRAGITPAAWARYESGSRTPSLAVYSALCEALGLPLDAILAPAGWTALPTPLLRPETLVAMRDPEGFEQVYALICKRIREAMEVAQPLSPVAPGRRQRSREDVLLKGHKPPAKRGRGGGSGGKA